MGRLVMVGLSPHPPLLIPEIGGSDLAKVRSTVDGLDELGRSIARAKPGTIIVISPHAPVFHDAIAINGSPSLRGDFGLFGASGVRLEFECDTELVKLISETAERNGIPVVVAEKRWQTELDYATLVPLYYISKHISGFRLVSISMGMLCYEELYAFGLYLRKAIENRPGSRAAVIASGDLSHRLTRDAPAGYSPSGKLFDGTLVELLARSDIKGLFDIDHELIEDAGECGFRPLLMALGTLDGFKISSRKLSYEGPFGVGYAAFSFEPGDPDPARELLPVLLAGRKKEMQVIRSRESAPVRLAREAVELYVRTGQVLDPPSVPEEWMKGSAGVFVSIKKGGQLRGCIGTIFPVKRNIAEEIIANAISASSEDPRFLPVRPDELDSLVYSVDVLAKPERVTSLDQLDTRRYGVIVRHGARTGLLLPNLEGVETVEDQINICRRKAGIGPDEDIEIERFEVTRYH